MKGIIATTHPELMEEIARAFPDWLVVSTIEIPALVVFYPAP